MAVKTKPEPGYTYEATYGADSPQPGLTETVGDVRLAELYDEKADFEVTGSTKVEGYDEHLAEVRKAEGENGKPKTDPEPDPQKEEV